MDEQFLHYIWIFQKLNGKPKTTCGQEVSVINQGNHNQNSGPDFEDARIKISDIEWAGKIEIHINSSDWHAHNHHLDKAYKSVILHVVWNHDKEVLLDGSPIPTLELKHLINQDEYEKYHVFINQKKEILCQDQLPDISTLSFTNLLDRMMVERLKQKAVEIFELVELKNADWEEVTYLSLARNFGFSVNKEPFFNMASSLPHKVISKNIGNGQAVEALIFGQAGFLEDETESYQRDLTSEYKFLKRKFQLQGKMTKAMWKFGRMRPSNFPTVRLAQFAALIQQSDRLFSKLIEINDPGQVLAQFEFDVSDYWIHHYDFGKIRKKKGGSMGRASINVIIINTITPLLAAYSTYTDNRSFMDKAIRLLEVLPAESNSITKKWTAVDREPKSAFDSQSLIGLYKNYCSKRKCLNCSIGVEILGR